MSEKISIHAPARGATLSRLRLAACTAQFQSTLPRGERPAGGKEGKMAKEFQSTLPRGERQKWLNIN